MDQWPGISILLPTYNRTQTVAMTISRLHQFLIYPGQITYWLGVDNDNESALQVASYIMEVTGLCVNAIDGPRRKIHKPGSLGANINMLLSATHDNLLMQMDDDHHIQRTIDLTSHVEKLLTDTSSGWIRLMGVGFHRYCACLDGRYWRVNWDSPELYIPSNRPHIKHRRFHDHFGLYPEGLKLGETEEAFCHKCKDIASKVSGPQVLVPLDVLTETSFDHVGHSFQLLGE